MTHGDVNGVVPESEASTTRSTSSTGSVIMPWGSARMKEDMVQIISQWLADEGFGAARQALLEEADIKLREREDQLSEKRKLRNYLLGKYMSNFPHIRG